MSFFKKLGKGIAKIGKGFVKTVAKVGQVAIGVATPIVSTAVGAVLPGGLGRVAAGAVSGVGMGLQNLLSPKEQKEVAILHDEQTVRAAALAPAVMESAAAPGASAAAPALLPPSAPAVTPAVVQGLATATQVQMNNQQTGMMEIVKKWFWVPIVCVLGYMLLKRK